MAPCGIEGGKVWKAKRKDEKGKAYAAVSVKPYPPNTGAKTIEINRCVSFAIGPAPLRHNLNLPPVASLALLNTTASNTPAAVTAPGSPLSIKNSFALNAAQNMFLTIALLCSTFPTMPFRTVSQMAGTPTRIVGLNSAMSPLQFFVDALEMVFGEP